MNSIYLLRHCDYSNPRTILPGRLPLELSELGKGTAVRLKDYFADKKIGKIYSSAVLRCKQTSEIIADQKVSVVFDQRLLETFSAYQGYWGENWFGSGWNFFSHRSELGGEGLNDIQRRMADFWDEITPSLSDNIIICSHGDPIQTLYSYIYKIPLIDENYNEPLHPQGWLEKGQYIEIIKKDGRILEASKPQTI